MSAIGMKRQKENADLRGMRIGGLLELWESSGAAQRLGCPVTRSFEGETPSLQGIKRLGRIRSVERKGEVSSR